MIIYIAYTPDENILASSDSFFQFKERLADVVGILFKTNPALAKSIVFEELTFGLSKSGTLKIVSREAFNVTLMGRIEIRDNEGKDFTQVSFVLGEDDVCE